VRPQISSPSLPGLFVAAGGIYTAQSLVGGLTFLGVPAVLRAENVALDRIGLVSLAMLVWALKFLWAAPVDALRIASDGRRRSRIVILLGEAAVVLALAAFGMAGSGDFSTLLALLVLMAVASATVDIACDAFLIEQFSQEKRGLANVAQVGGGYLGLIFGSGLFVAASAAIGWMAASLLLAGLVVVLSIPMALVREHGTTRRAPSQTPTLLRALGRREVRIGIVMTILFEAGGRLAQALAGPFLIDAGLSLTSLGLLNGAGGVGAGLLGTAVGGLLAHRFGARKAMVRVACLHVVSLGALTAAVLLAADRLWLLTGLFVLESGMMAAGFVVSYARLMAFASPSQPGVDFTLFQCASAVAAALCGMGGAMLASCFGYGPVFGIALVGAAYVPLLLLRLEARLDKGVSA
jgi:MFS transporter (putative signal transducer)